jgi:Omp85 superfamily domain
MQQRQTERCQRQSGIISRVCQSDCSSPHTRPISLVGVASQNENLKISSLVGRAIVTSPAIPQCLRQASANTAQVSTPIAGVPRSSDGTDLGTGRSVPGDPAGSRLKPGNGFGYGAGVRINTPFSPIRLDYARNNLGEERIQFGFGDRF